MLKGICFLRSFHGSISVSVERTQSSTFFCLFPLHFIFSFPSIFFFSFLRVFYPCFLTYFSSSRRETTIMSSQSSVICVPEIRVWLPLGVKLCALESSACRGNSRAPSCSGYLYAREIAISALYMIIIGCIAVYCYVSSYSVGCLSLTSPQKWRRTCLSWNMGWF